MSAFLEAILLGIIQGLTEFLPVSSSGHLELANALMNKQQIGGENMQMTVVLHFATALSTIVIFRKDIIEILSGLFNREDRTQQYFSLKIILSMIPAAVIGVLFEDQLEQLFTGNTLFVGFMLIITGALLYFADKAKSTGKEVSWKDSLIIGIAQAIAILPGISRSGATISTSVLLKIDRAKAARFSFLMVVPLIFGKMAKDLLDPSFFEQGQSLSYLGTGFIAAFLTGLLACNWMIKLVKQSKLIYFALYCLVVGLLAIAINIF
jgi:undecaprenyl-diphosphatase